MPRQIEHVNSNTDLQPAFGVRLDEIDYTSVFGQGFSASHDSEAAFAATTLPVLRPFPLVDGRHTIRLYAGWAGAGDSPLVFSGEIVATNSRYFRREDGFSCGGYLKRTEVGLDLNVAFYYSGGSPEEVQALLDQIDLDFQAVPILTDADIIVFILECYGITPETTNYRIEASPWGPARLSPIYWESGTPGYQLIKQIDEITTFRTFDRRDGAIGRRQLLGTVPSSVRHTFTEGVDILDLQVGKSFNVFNQVIVRGAAIESTGEQVEGISPISGPVPSPYIADPPGVRTDETINSPLIETVEDAELLADIRLGLLREPLQQFTLTTFGCADLEVGDAVGVYAPGMGVVTNAFVVAHTLSGQPFRSQLTLRGSTAAQPRPNQPPTAAFTATALKETVIISGTATPLTLITVDASTSSDSDGTLAAVTINIGGTVYTPDPAHPTVTHPYLGLPPVAISVTVTDDGGLSSTLAQSVTWDESTIIVEPIATAELTRGELSDDAEVTWREFAGDVISVAPITLGSATLWGGQSGTIWRSTDRLKTAPTVAATLPAAVLCLWNNESATARWLAGLANGDIWLSIDGGTTWTKQAQLAAAVNDISESPYLPGQASACSGNALYETFDLRTWTPIVTKTGATALRLAAGFARGWVGFNDGTVQSTNGTTITLPGGAVRGLTLEREAEVLHIYTDAAAPGGGFLSYRWTEAGGLVAGPNLPTAPNQAIRSGEGRFSYIACDGSLVKEVWDANQVFDVRIMGAPQQCLAVGYSSAVHPPSLVEVVIPTAGAATGMTWCYAPTHSTPDKWVGTICPPLDGGRYPVWLAANPFNPSEWLLLVSPALNPVDGYSFVQGGAQLFQADGTTPALWLSQDNRQTWTAVTVGQGAGGGGGRVIRIRNVEWSDTTTGRWMMAGFNNDDTSCLFRGTGGTGAVAAYADSTTHSGDTPRAQYVAAGLNDDAIVGNRDGLPAYATLADTRISRLTSNSTTVRSVERAPDSRALAGLSFDSSRIMATPDYRGASPTERSSVALRNQYDSLTWALHGLYVASTDAPIRRVTDLFNPRDDGATIVTIENPTTATSASLVRADRQRRESVLARLATSSGPDTRSFVSADGVQWTLLEGPTAALGGTLAGIGEIVTRSGGTGTPPPPEA